MAYRGICVIGVLSLAASTGSAANVDLLGDLGNVNFPGASFSPINSTVTTSFTHFIPGFGLVVGDAIAFNTGGTSLALRLTNLTFTVQSPIGPSAPKTDILLVATQTYQVPAATAYNSSHQLFGQWTTAAGNGATLTTILDFNASNTALATISILNTAQATTFTGLSGIGGTTTSSLFTIHTSLRLTLDGTGSIQLPSSADVDVEIVPAPGAAATLGLAGLLAARGRRR